MSKPAKHQSQGLKIQKEVWITGTANTTVAEGTAVTYDRTIGVATEADERRDNHVKIANSTDKASFAGVLDRDVSIPSTGKARCLINEPGSVCIVLSDIATTINSTGLVASATSGTEGEFIADGGKTGRGTALALQTIGSAGLCLVKLHEGPEADLPDA